MFLLNFLPDWWPYALVLVGLVAATAGWLFSKVSFIAEYAVLIRWVGVLLMFVGAYFAGAVAEKKVWELKIAELEAKVANAEARAAKINTEVVTKVLVKKQVIKEKGEEVIKYIDREITRINGSCVVPTEAITAHNAAATNSLVKEKSK